MSFSDFFKKKTSKTVKEEKAEIVRDDRAPGWDAITAEFERIYPGQTAPKHIAAKVPWQLGGNDPLQGISIYEDDDAYHFVTYGLSELYEKESQNKDVSGFGMEFTLRLKRCDYQDTDRELFCIAGIFQSIARLTFNNGEIFKPFEYLYTGQTAGVDAGQKSGITGFITVPDTKAQTLVTENGNVEFVEFIGATDGELKAILNKQITVPELYKLLGTDITDYSRESVLSAQKSDYSSVTTHEELEQLVTKGELFPIYLIDTQFNGSQEADNTVYVPKTAAQLKGKIDDELERLLACGEIKSLSGKAHYKDESLVPSKITFEAAKDGNTVYTNELNIW